MQYKQTVAVLVFLVFPFLSFAQTTTYLPVESSDTRLLERLEIKAGTDSVLNFSKTKPYSRQQMIPVIEKYYHRGELTNGVGQLPPTTDSAQRANQKVYASLTDEDLFNARLALEKNNEWAKDTFVSQRPVLNRFYQTPANALEVNTKDFFLALNPVVQFKAGKESGYDQLLFLNTRGLELRGTIADKIGFQLYVTENQERDPQYVQRYVSERQAVPGNGYYKNFHINGYDYFDARGTVTFKATKYIDVAFGYDKNFIGNGYRSLFLSDFANNALFLRLNTRIWKFHYQNLFMELVNSYRRGADRLLDKKYASIHHLDIALTKWLNAGFFEAIVFGRPNHFEFGYLNPVIFYRSAEQQNGSDDNALLGFDLKANLARHVQVYGQFLLDDLSFAEIKKKWWGNKYGIQVGAKYIDAFGVPNLDLQAELNRVRPYTYSHGDSVANYTHYNLPLAHPLGANFNEVLGSLCYQFARRWLFETKAMFYRQGRDTGSISYGANIFLPNEPPYRVTEYGVRVGAGAPVNVSYASLLLSYQWKPNLFFEVSTVLRKQSAYGNVPENSTSVFYAGVRWNMQRRAFVF